MTNAARDEDLVRECRNGDERAFETLVDRYYGKIFNAAFRLVGRYEDAKDVTQNVFFKAYASLAQFDPRYKFYSWVYRIAVNESLNLLSREGRLEPLAGDRPSERRDPEQSLAGTELSRHVQEALMGLKTEYRVVIVLRHFMHCSYHEIADIAQIPEKTVKSRLFTARQMLRERLAQKGVVR